MEENIKKEKKKIQNLTSLVILLSGLFVGSLFIDAGQIIKGGGYSQKNLNKSDIFEASGKTWVAYTESAVLVSVINDDKCEKCDPNEVLIWLRRVLPTISAEKISFDSEKGKKIIEEFNIKNLPAFIFDKNVDESDLYVQAEPLFKLKNNRYVLNTQLVGLPVGKYLELPKINEDDAIFGKIDAKVKVVVFSDFQCPYCKLFYKSLQDTMKKYKDGVVFVYKDFPLLDIHPQANSAALSAKCALEQNKFWEYADTLYAKQAQWGSTKDTVNFKSYAKALRLNSDQFNKCLDDKKYQNKIDEDRLSAEGFGISGTPTIFINDQVESGVFSTEELKKAIDDKLAK